MESNVHTLVGTTLGTCVLERLVGSGGMGMVYLAQQTRPSREVAVKILRPRTGMQVQEEERQEFLSRFRHEANVIARLDHINILPIYEYGEQDELAYLVMPYLAGGSLRDVLKQRGRLSPQEALKYTEQAAAALDYAHAHKIVHRDIKPGNMLFHADGRLVLVDFGIARIVQDDTTTDTARTDSGFFLGSVDYMAPEMVRGRHLDHRTDIYELGIVLFQMLTGRVPFQGDSPFVIAAQHLQEPPPSLYDINPLISPMVDAVVQKALAKSPEDRYTSAGELAQELTDAVMMPDSTSWKHALPLSSLPTIPAVTTPHDYEHMPGMDVTPGSAIPETPEQPAHFHSRGILRRLSYIGLALALVLAIGTFLLKQSAIRGFWTLSKQASPSASTHSVLSTTPIPSPIVTLSPAQTPTASQQAQGVIQHYYDDINQSNYQDAYQQWGTDYQSQISYNQFANGYMTTRHDDIVFGTTTPQSNGMVIITMTVYAMQGNSPGTSINVFQGSYTVGQENGKWKLLAANLQPIGTTVTTPLSQQDSAQAQNVVQQYYNAINRSDYHSAYQLWGSEYQNSYSYTQFASGFATTKHDDVRITNITQLSSGVFRVEVTIKTTQETKSGTTTSTYNGSYVVGQENGAWKFLTAYLQKES